MIARLFQLDKPKLCLEELCSFSFDGNVMAASIEESGGSFAIAGVRRLFVCPFLNSHLRTKDGQRFIGSAALDTSALPLNVITNWTAQPPPGNDLGETGLEARAG